MLIEHDVSRYIVMCRDGGVLGQGAPAARAAIPVVSVEVW
jgi:hypothetical protein